MTSSAYVDHSRNASEQGHNAQTPLSFGVLYPRHDLIAVIDDEGQAEQGARALVQAGIPDERIDVLSGRAFTAQIAAAKRRRGLFSRLGALLSRLFSDDAAYEQSLIDEARQNHALLIVHAAERPLVERVREIVRAYGAHGVRYYGRGAIEDLV